MIQNFLVGHLVGAQSRWCTNCYVFFRWLLVLMDDQEVRPTFCYCGRVFVIASYVSPRFCTLDTTFINIWLIHWVLATDFLWLRFDLAGSSLDSTWAYTSMLCLVELGNWQGATGCASCVPRPRMQEMPWQADVVQQVSPRKAGINIGWRGLTSRHEHKYNGKYHGKYELQSFWLSFDHDRLMSR